MKSAIRSREQVWHQFFADPWQWWDDRLTKKNSKQPDFRHKYTLESLWIDSRSNPSWVKGRIATLDFLDQTRQRNPFCNDGEDETVQKLCKEGKVKDALHLVERMLQQTPVEEAPKDAYMCLLKECGKRKILTEGKRVHAFIAQSKCESNIFLANNLIDMYSKCTSPVDARMVFNAMPRHNVFSWTAIISAYADSGDCEEAINLYKEMQNTGTKPDKIVFVVVLKACTRTAALEIGKQIHSLILEKGVHLDLILQNTLIDMYAKCGSLDDACQIFNSICQRDVVSWNSMISGYAQNGLGREAIALYEQMKQEGIQADRVTFICILKACANSGLLEQGKQIHSLIVQKGFHLDMILQSTLVDMYAKCGSLDDALELFNNMSERDAVSWNAMIGGYARNGLGTEAIALYEEMQREGMQASKVTFMCVLKACANSGALKQGKQIHSLIVQKGFHLDMILCSTLVDMYAKCGCLDDARELFNDMSERDVVSWNAMIAGYAQNELGKEAITLYEQMKQQGMLPDKVTFVCVLKACADIGALEQGKQIHSLILQKGFHLDMILQSTLVDMYAKCGCIDYARELFNKMIDRDVVSWNAMIAGYAQNGLGREAIALYEQMNQQGMQANKVTFVCVLKACANSGALEQGKQIHSLIIQKGFHLDMILQSTLVDMYAKCGFLDDARELFNNMSERGVVSWNAMIAGYAQNGLGTEAVALYEQMKQEGMQADKITFVCVLKACADSGALEQGKQVHFLLMQKDFHLDMVLQSTLVDMYAKCGCLSDARELFDKMSERDVVSWNAMIAGYAQNGLGTEAIALYEQMKQEGMQADKVTFVCILKACANSGAFEQGKQIHSIIVQKSFHLDMILQSALVDMYAKCGCLDDARALFNNMSERDVVSWNAMIAGYAQNGLGREAIALYEQMKQEGMQADKVRFLCVLKACADSGALEQGKQIHSLIMQNGFHLDMILQSTLVDMYAKCGCLSNARELFDKMSERDVVSWNAMMAGYAQNGLGAEAIALYEQMKEEGMQPDKVTLICVLKACANSGALEQGKKIHSVTVQKGFHLDMILQSTLVDMYAKCGCLDDARELFNNMSDRDVVSWNAMIAGYAQNGLGTEAIALYEQMKKEGILPNDVTYICVLSACSHSGLVKEGFCVFDFMCIYSVVIPTLEHYASMVDLLCRAGWFAEAMDLIMKMPIQPDPVVWMSLLGAARNSGIVEIAQHAFDYMVKLEPEKAASYLLLIDIYAHVGQMDKVAEVRKEMMDKGA